MDDCSDTSEYDARQQVHHGCFACYSDAVKAKTASWRHSHDVLDRVNVHSCRGKHAQNRFQS